MEQIGRIRKVVGRQPLRRPLQRAFTLRKMIVELRGNDTGSEHGHIRKTVGGPKQERG